MVDFFNPSGRGTGVQGGINAVNQLFGGIDQREQNKLARQQQFIELDDQRKGAMFTDARTVNSFLKSGQTGQALNVLSNRLSFIEQFGGDPTDTREIADFISAGDIQGATSLLDSVEDAGVKTVNQSTGKSFLSDPLEAQRKRELSVPALSDTEKSFKKLTSLEAQLSAANKTGDKDAIEAATNQVNNFKTLSGKFGASTQTKADIAVDKANRIALSKQASDASSTAFKGLKNVRSTILNMGDAIKALDKGADTGPIISKLPSFRESSIELDNVRSRMGLDVVGSTTFGALSESELAFALDTALPDNLQPKALKSWLKRKQTSQRKLAKGLRDAAVFLGKPGNTIADYIERQELKTKELSSVSGLSDADQEELRQLEAEFGGQ